MGTSYNLDKRTSGDTERERGVWGGFSLGAISINIKLGQGANKGIPSSRCILLVGFPEQSELGEKNATSEGMAVLVRTRHPFKGKAKRGCLNKGGRQTRKTRAWPNSAYQGPNHPLKINYLKDTTRSSSREVRIRVPIFLSVYFSRRKPSQPKSYGKSWHQSLGHLANTPGKIG